MGRLGRKGYHLSFGGGHLDLCVFKLDDWRYPFAKFELDCLSTLSSLLYLRQKTWLDLVRYWFFTVLCGRLGECEWFAAR